MIKQTTLEPLGALRQHLETIEPGQPVTLTAAACPSDAIRQGDLYLIVVDKVPEGYKKARKPSCQLVPGNTQGSKHCLDSLAGVEMYLPQEWSEESLDGPCFILSKERMVLHPTHGTVTIASGHIVLCRYQREWDKEQAKERRNRD